MSLASIKEGTHISVIPGIEAQVVSRDSSLYADTLRLQALRFGPTVKPRPAAGDAYLQITDYAPDLTLAIAVRNTVPIPNEDHYLAPGTLLGAARLELSGGTFTESCMRLRPGSIAAVALTHGQAAEIGGFATPTALDRVNLLDVIDNIVALTISVAKDLGIEWLWIFPRMGFMSLLLATIPDVLPPYHYTYSRDVLGWNETNDRWQQFLSLRPRGLQALPELYEISRARFEADLKQRLALRLRRVALRSEMNDLVFHAMRQAHRDLARKVAELRASDAASVPPASAAAQSASSIGGPGESGPAPARDALDERPSALAFSARQGASVTDVNVEYLRTVMREGRSAASDYKALSHRLLDLKAGMSVLDVGCGIGLDLATLSAQVGPGGRAIGLDLDAELVAIARQSLDQAGIANAIVFQGNAERLTFPSGLFDRVRADRTIQHMRHPRQAVAEMWRVLRPGGILTVIEPDWKAVALYPASAGGGNDDSTFVRLLEWIQRDISQALIGRRLRSLLHEVAGDAWSFVDIRVEGYSFTDWQPVDSLLLISESAHLLAEEDPPLAAELESWLRSLRDAADSGAFFALVPLFFACAQKAAV